MNKILFIVFLENCNVNMNPTPHPRSGLVSPKIEGQCKQSVYLRLITDKYRKIERNVDLH